VPSGSSPIILGSGCVDGMGGLMRCQYFGHREGFCPPPRPFPKPGNTPGPRRGSAPGPRRGSAPGPHRGSAPGPRRGWAPGSCCGCAPGLAGAVPLNPRWGFAPAPPPPGPCPCAPGRGVPGRPPELRPLGPSPRLYPRAPARPFLNRGLRPRTALGLPEPPPGLPVCGRGGGVRVVGRGLTSWASFGVVSIAGRAGKSSPSGDRGPGAGAEPRVRGGAGWGIRPRSGERCWRGP